MGSNQLPILSVEEELAQALTSAQLEDIYQRALQRSEIIYEEEKARVLRVQLLLLENENFDLQEQLAEVEDRSEKLEDNCEHIRQQLHEAESQVITLQNELKLRLREADNHKAELNALQNVSADSTKLLTEKLALSRELSSLKPELEHLKSQTALNQTALAEKLALQREVMSLQVELETERRALQRLKAKDSRNSDDENKATEQTEELRKELTKEKKETQRVEREMRKQAAEWEGQKSILESKLDAFRNKLRSTKDQLKESQAELEKAQAAAKVVLKPAATTNPRKRPVARFDPDMTIGTPGESHAAKRARVSASTAPGEKSTFSITPFLNKTTSILMDTPDPSKEDQQQRAVDLASPIPSRPSVNLTSSPIALEPKVAQKAPPPAKAQPKPKPLSEAAATKVNAAVGATSKTASKLSLPKVTEEADEDHETSETTKSSLQTQPTKKKQKILGGRAKSTIFDEDEAEQPKPRGRSLLGGHKGLGLRGGALSLAAKPKSLAEFSPLKKDRRPIVT